MAKFLWYNVAMMLPRLLDTAVAAPGFRWRPDRFTLLVAAIALLGVGLVLGREVTYGPGVGWDAVVYMSVAQSLLDGQGFAQFTGSPLTPFPPLYSLLLAAAGLGVVSPLAVAGPLNAAIFGLTIFVVGQYLKGRLQSRFLAAWGCIAVALSIPLADVSSFVLSEPLFILMATLALIQTDKFLNEGQTSSLVWAAVFCALAWQTRYIGGTVPAVVGLLLLFQRGVTLPQKARRVVGFSLIAGLPMVLWLLRNYLSAGDLPGNANPVDFTIPGILSDIGRGLWGWVYTADMSLAQWLALALLALAAVVILAGCVFTKGQWRELLSSQRLTYCVFGGFGLTYVALLIAAMMLGHTWHGVHSRFLVPLYIPLLVIVVITMDRVLACAPDLELPAKVGRLPVIGTFVGKLDRNPGWLTAGLGIILSLWAAVQVVPNIAQISLANSGELFLEYSGPRWADSETLRYIKENPITGEVYSNELALLWIHNEGSANYYSLPISRLPPRIIQQENAAYNTGPEQLSRWLADTDDGVYVIWFSNWWNNDTYDYGDADLRMTRGLEPVAEFSDGAVYRVNRGYAPPGNPYHSAYQDIASGDYGQPAGRSTFNVYFNDASMVYIKEPCQTADIRDNFFLNIIPADVNDLPPNRDGWSSDNLGFSFPQRGLVFDDVCLAIVPLPDYEIARFVTGQSVSGQDDPLWLLEQDYVTSSSHWQAEYESILSGGYGDTVSRADFDVYLGAGRLAYFKEPCAAADTGALFFLHLFPAKDGDLFGEGREYGFNNMDFEFSQHGVRWDGKCLAVVALPDYAIALIRAGQYIVDSGEVLWQAEINPSALARFQEMADSLADLRPVADEVFELYLDGGKLIYHKDPCAAGDTRARFFLHILPAEVNRLPVDRREHGFDNPDFYFSEHGAHRGGKCLASVALPDYAIERIRTGQFVADEGQLWRAEFAAGE